MAVVEIIVQPNDTTEIIREPSQALEVYFKRGDTGPQGAQGPQGLKGDTGLTGAAGTNGTNGTNGAEGPQGAQGDTGPKGDTGLTGFAWDINRFGANGYVIGDIVNYLGNYYICIANNDALIPTSALGVYWNPYSFVGPAGNDGATGAEGPQGPQGDPGPQGLTGETGLTGPKGDPGDPGPAGTNGTDGATGAKGDKGDKGDTGPSSTGVTLRNNLATNPNNEIDAAGWTSLYSNTIRTTNNPHLGTYCVEANPDSESGDTGLRYTQSGLTIGTSYRVGLWVRASGNGGSNTGLFAVSIGGGSPVVYFTPSTSWQFVQSSSIVAQSTTISAELQIGFQGVSIFADSLIIELASTYTGTFFDGNTAPAGGFTYAWNGTANASTSTATGTVTFSQIAGAIPPYGTTGQVLAKTSDSSYATSWTSLQQSQVTNLVTDLASKSSTVSAMAGQSSTLVDAFPRNQIRSECVVTQNRVWLSFFTPAENATVTQVSMHSGAIPSAGLSGARMGLYIVEENLATLVAQTASDTTLFNATNTLYTRLFDTANGYPSNYTLVAGQRYALGFWLAGTTMPTILGAVNLSAAINNLQPRLSGTSVFTGGFRTIISTYTATANILWGRFS